MHPISEKICNNCEKFFLISKLFIPSIYFRIIFAYRVNLSIPLAEVMIGT
jgi:hypothetical protein